MDKNITRYTSSRPYHLLSLVPESTVSSIAPAMNAVVQNHTARISSFHPGNSPTSTNLSGEHPSPSGGSLRVSAPVLASFPNVDFPPSPKASHFSAPHSGNCASALEVCIKGLLQSQTFSAEKPVDRVAECIRVALRSGEWGALTDDFASLESQLTPGVKNRLNTFLENVRQQASNLMALSEGDDTPLRVLQSGIERDGFMQTFLWHSCEPNTHQREMYLGMLGKIIGEEGGLAVQLVYCLRDINTGLALHRVDALDDYLGKVKQLLDTCENTGGELIKGRIKETIFELRRKVETSLFEVKQGQNAMSKTTLSQMLTAVNSMTSAMLSLGDNSEVSIPSCLSEAYLTLDNTADALRRVNAVDNDKLARLISNREQFRNGLSVKLSKKLSVRDRLSLLEKQREANNALELFANESVEVRRLLKILHKPGTHVSQRYINALKECEIQPLQQDRSRLLTLLRTILEESAFYDAALKAGECLPDASSVGTIGNNVKTLLQALETQGEKVQREAIADECLALFSALNQWLGQGENARKAAGDDEKDRNFRMQRHMYASEREASLQQQIAVAHASEAVRQFKDEKTDVMVLIYGTEYRIMEGEGQYKSAMTGAVISPIMVKVSRSEQLKYLRAEEKGEIGKASELIQKWAKDNADKIPDLEAQRTYTDNLTGTHYKLHVEWKVDELIAYSGSDRQYRPAQSVHSVMKETLDVIKGAAPAFSPAADKFTSSLGHTLTPSTLINARHEQSLRYDPSQGPQTPDYSTIIVQPKEHMMTLGTGQGVITKWADPITLGQLKNALIEPPSGLSPDKSWIFNLDPEQIIPYYKDMQVNLAKKKSHKTSQSRKFSLPEKALADANITLSFNNTWANDSGSGASQISEAKPIARNHKKWDPSQEVRQGYVAAQSVSWEQEQEISLAAADLPADEQISLQDYTRIPNKPDSSGSRYSDCLLFSLVQHMTQCYDADDQNNREWVYHYRTALVNKGWHRPGVQGGFAEDGYMHSNSESTRLLINAINTDLERAGQRPLRVILHQFSPIETGGSIADFTDTHGPIDGRVVHIRSGDQHFEALVLNSIANEVNRNTTRQANNMADKTSVKGRVKAENGNKTEHEPDVDVPLTLEQKKYINKYPTADFLRWLSHVISYPIIEKKLSGETFRYEAGEISIGSNNIENIASAIKIYQKGDGTFMVIVTEKTSNNESENAIKVFDNVSILNALTADIENSEDKQSIIDLFDERYCLQNLKERASILYGMLLNNTATSAEHIARLCEAISENLRGLPLCCTYIVIQEIFKLLRGTEDRLLGSVALSVVKFLGVPPGDMLERLTQNMLKNMNLPQSQCNKTVDVAVYIYKLAIRASDRYLSGFNESIELIINDFNSVDNTAKRLRDLFVNVRLCVFNMMNRDSQPVEDYQPLLLNVFNALENAINNSSITPLKKSFILLELFPIISFQPNNFDKKFINQAVYHFKTIVNAGKFCDFSRFIGKTDDAVISMLISKTMRYKAKWLLAATVNFELGLKVSGQDGNMPMATIELINNSYFNVSKERGREILQSLFNANIKTNRKSNGMVMLSLGGVYPEEFCMPIYQYFISKEVIGVFSTYWKHYRKLANDKIADGQYVIIDQDGYYTVDKSVYKSSFSQSSQFPVALPLVSARGWVEKCKDVEHYIFSEDKCDDLLTAILIAAADNAHKMDVVRDIIAANLIIKGSSSSTINNRLQKILNMNHEQDEHDKLLEIILLIQINMLDSKRIDSVLMENLNGNLSSCKNVVFLMSKLNMIGEVLNRGKIDVGCYLDIVVNLLKKSIVKPVNMPGDLSNHTSTIGVTYRTAMVNIACKKMDSMGKFAELCQAFSGVSLNLSINHNREFHWFTRLVSQEIISPERKEALKPQARGDFAKFLTATLDAWWSFESACKDDIGMNELDIEWVMNPTVFLAAHSDVQAKMLGLHSTLGANLSDFLVRCLVEMQRGITTNSPDKNKKLGITLNIISDTVQITNPDSIVNIANFIADAFQKLKEAGFNARTVSKNTLTGLLKKIDKDKNPEQFDALSIKLHEFVKDDAVQEYHPPIFKDDAKGYRKYSTTSASESDLTENRHRIKNRKNRKASTLPTSESATDSVKFSKKITPRQVYLDKGMDDFNVNQSVIDDLSDVLNSFVSSIQLTHGLKFHAYYNSHSEKTRFSTFDLKPKDKSLADQKKSGRSNWRGLLVHGGDNKYILVGAGDHDEIKRTFNSKLKEFPNNDSVNSKIAELIKNKHFPVFKLDGEDDVNEDSNQRD